MKKLLLISLILVGCTHTTVVVNLTPERNITMQHDSGFRRGCYKLAGDIKNEASARMVAQDRSASHDLTAMATVAAAAVAGPAGAAVTAAGDSVGRYFEGKDDGDQDCHFITSSPQTPPTSSPTPVTPTAPTVSPAPAPTQ